MWDSPASRAGTSKSKKKKKRRFPVHMKRTHVQLKKKGLGNTESILVARLLLNDFSPRGVEVFSPEALEVGQELSITVDEPKRFFCKGRVIACHEMISDTVVLTQVPHRHRIAIEFVFDNPAEEDSVKAYWEEIRSEFVAGSPLAA